MYLVCTVWCQRLVCSWAPDAGCIRCSIPCQSIAHCTIPGAYIAKTTSSLAYSCAVVVQVNAAVGCLARMPLPHSAFRPLESRFDDNQPQGPLNRPSSRFSPDLWQPYLRDTALRIFGSVGLTGQLGRFTRPVLDFTAGETANCTVLFRGSELCSKGEESSQSAAGSSTIHA